MAYQHIGFEIIDERILRITFDVPDRMNAISPEINEELFHAWGEFRENPALLVAILTGSGERAFCVGSDLRSHGAGHTRPAFPYGGITRDYQGVFKPIIAAINGWAAGGGLEIALACDIRVAARSARFILPETALGGTAGAGGTQRLPRTVPIGVAMDMLLTGQALDAEEALRWGLVSRVFDDDGLRDGALEMARAICARAPLSIKATKQAMVQGVDMTLSLGLELEALLAQRLRESEDVREGIRAFLEKRPPEFRGV